MMLYTSLLATLMTGVAEALSNPLSQVPASAWKNLNTSVSGRLGFAQPLALPCYLRYSNGTSTADASSINAPDVASCKTVQQSKTDPEFIANHPGGYVTYNFASCPATNVGCPLSAFAPADPVSPIAGVCYQAGVPARYIDVRSVSDIQAGFAFANKWRIPLVVKNTGHDYRGRSAGTGSLALWTRNIQPSIKLDRDFTPGGCASGSGPALTYGAGQGFAGLYDLADKHGYMLIGGASATVGASGGWVAGGGHSFASTTYGLGVDNVLQMRVVLPNGKYITANRCQNQDVFFALRGGGGGTFGVITETTSRLRPKVPFQMASITFASLDLNSKQEFINLLIQNAEKFASDGWGGYIGPDVASGRAFLVSLVTPKLTLAQAKTSMKPLTDFAKNLSELNVAVSANVTELQDGYYGYYNSQFVKLFTILNNVGLTISSRLIPKFLFQGQRNQRTLSNALLDLMNSNNTNPLIPLFVLLVPPASYQLPSSDLPGGPGYASVTPAWRNSLWHVISQTFWDPADPTASGSGSEAAAFAKSSRAMDPLRALTPNSGAYQNEADPFEPDAPGSFWGDENYKRLLKIKKEVDPNNVLTCYKCVGWEPADKRYSCYPHIR